MQNDGIPSMGKIVAWTLGAFVLIYLIGWGLFGIRVMTAGIVGRGQAEIQIQSPGSRIPAYNHFFDLCASVQQAEAGIDQQTEMLNSATTEDDKQRIRTNVSALQMTRANGIYQYNADAAKDYTIGQFRDSKLPYRLSDEPYKAGGEKTQCSY